MGINLVKSVGIIVIIAASLMTGLTLSDRVKRHYVHLKNIVLMLNETEIMLRYNACTIKELFAHLKACSELKTLDFLDVRTVNASDIKETVVDKIQATSLELSEDEKKSLISFFRELGSTDMQGQLAIVKHYKEYFNGRAAAVYEECGSKCRLYRSLGALGGAFLAVIII